jgi:hypothetical protein
MEPTVPRGIREGLFSEPLLDKDREHSTKPHSKQTSSEWVEGAWGHSAPSNLTSRRDIINALHDPTAMMTMVVENGKPSESNTLIVRKATNLTVPPPTLSTFTTSLESRLLVHSNLATLNHTALQSQIQVRQLESPFSEISFVAFHATFFFPQAPVHSWQETSSATFSTSASDITELGASGSIPTPYSSKSGEGPITHVAGPDSGATLSEARVEKKARSLKEKQRKDRERVAAKRQSNPLMRASDAKRTKWRRHKKMGCLEDYDTWCLSNS